jgi:hypothetical protein
MVIVRVSSMTPSNFQTARSFLTFLQEGQQATVLRLPVTHEGVKVAKPE